MSIVRGNLHGHPRAASLDAARTQSWTDGQTDKDNTKQKVTLTKVTQKVRETKVKQETDIQTNKVNMTKNETQYNTKIKIRHKSTNKHQAKVLQTYYPTKDAGNKCS